MDQHALMRVLGGSQLGGPPRTGLTAVEGVVHSVVAAGLRFTVPDWDGGIHVFGPAPWPRSLVEPTALVTQSAGDPAHTHADEAHDHVGSTPVVGDRCAVLFIGNGIDNPWVVGFWPA